jgi:hypothetical protein
LQRDACSSWFPVAPQIRRHALHRRGEDRRVQAGQQEAHEVLLGTLSGQLLQSRVLISTKPRARVESAEAVAVPHRRSTGGRHPSLTVFRALLSCQVIVCDRQRLHPLPTEDGRLGTVALLDAHTAHASRCRARIATWIASRATIAHKRYTLAAQPDRTRMPRMHALRHVRTHGHAAHKTARMEVPPQVLPHSCIIPVVDVVCLQSG